MIESLKMEGDSKIRIFGLSKKRARGYEDIPLNKARDLSRGEAS